MLGFNRTRGVSDVWGLARCFSSAVAGFPFLTVAAPTGATLFWKIQPALPGQTTGARKTP